jgi:hypothetical protein
MVWFFHTRVWRKMHGHEDGEVGVDNEVAEQSVAGIGAWILSATCLVLSGVHGRTIAGKVGGATSRRITRCLRLRTDASAAGPLKMAGGTEFRFVTEGIHAALEQAKAAAGGRDVRLGGGVSTIWQYLSRCLD